MGVAGRLAGALLAALVAVPASASTTQVCRVVPDAKGDAAYKPLEAVTGAAPGVPGTAADDLLSADVASDGTHLTVIWRMGQVQVPDSAAPLGRAYFFIFEVRDRGSWFVHAFTSPTGTQYSYGDFVQQTRVHAAYRVLGTGKGRLDTARGWVLADVPARAVAGGLRKGTYLRNLQASVDRWIGQGVVPDRTVAGQPLPLSGSGLSFDQASGDHYVVGQRSCLHPGL